MSKVSKFTYESFSRPLNNDKNEYRQKSGAEQRRGLKRGVKGARGGEWVAYMRHLLRVGTWRRSETFTKVLYIEYEENKAEMDGRRI